MGIFHLPPQEMGEKSREAKEAKTSPKRWNREESKQSLEAPVAWRSCGTREDSGGCSGGGFGMSFKGFLLVG